MIPGPAHAARWLPLLGLALGLAVPVSGQAPPDRDSLPPVPDSVPALPADTLEAGRRAPDALEADTLDVDSDTLDVSRVEVIELDQGQAGDTLFVLPPDSIFRVLPGLTEGASTGRDRGVTVWERDELLGNPALTLLDLLAQEPDLLPLRWGDFGAPEAVLGVGLAGGRVRVFADGFELAALSGANPDLSLIPLGGLERVRIERGGGELRVHLTSLQPFDPRPMSRVEAGTGDLDTNIFRGVFVHPRALGGSLGVTIERLDSQGPRGEEPGARQGVWLRYALHRGDDLGLSFDLRSATSQSSFDSIPASLSRTDWIVRGRSRLTDALTSELFVGSANLGAEDDGLTPVTLSRRQYGGRLSFDDALGPESAALRGWGRLDARAFDGGDLPGLRLDAVAGVESPRVGGIEAEWHRDRWNSQTLSSQGLRAWTAPVFGLSLFGGWDSGARGARVFVPRTEIVIEPDSVELGEPLPDSLVPPALRASDRTALRAGARLALGPIDVTAAWHRVRADSLVPPYSLTTRGASVVGLDEVEGYEVSGRLALPLVSGLGLVGTLMQWNEEGVWRPRRRYTGGLDFANQYYEGDQLEIRAQVKVEGRDPMWIPWPDPEAASAVDPGGDPTVDPGDGAPAAPTWTRVPFQQSWNAWLHIRIQSVRIFVRWDNLFLRAANQDFPGRVLPRTRAVYGVRWTLWN